MNSYSKQKRTSKLQHTSPVQSVMTCIKCQLKGHIAKNCRTKCFKCKRVGHSKKIVDLIILTVLENPLIMSTMLMMMMIHFA